MFHDAPRKVTLIVSIFFEWGPEKVYGQNIQGSGVRSCASWDEQGTEAGRHEEHSGINLKRGSRNPELVVQDGHALHPVFSFR